MQLQRADPPDVSSPVLPARVVLLTNLVPPYRLPLYEALADRVHELVVLLSQPVDDERTLIPGHGRLDVRIQRTVSFRRGVRHPAGFDDTSTVHIPWDTLGQLGRLRPDVIISAELGFRSLFSILQQCRRHRPAVVLWATLSERSESGRGALRAWLRRRLVRRADRIIVNGASGERYVMGLGAYQDRIDRVPYTADPFFGEQDRRVPPERPVRHLVLAGQLIERKGLVPFLQVIDEWSGRHRSERIRVSVAGTGPLGDDVLRSALSDRVDIRLLGSLSRGALRDLYREADALAFPTLADEWGVVVNEAMACGLPVLGSTASQAVDELCAEGETGWVFSPDSTESMRAALERALGAAPGDVAAMRRAARRRMAGLTPEWAADRIAQTVRRSLEA